MWVKGTDTLNATVVYGAQGLPALTNTPQGLYEAASWTDLQGNLWIFGGNNDVFRVYANGVAH